MSSSTRSPKAPKGLGVRGRKLWREVLAEFDASPAELVLIEALAGAVDRLGEAQEVLERDGMLDRDRFGQLRAHPAVAIAREASTVIARVTRQLGLTLDDEQPRLPKLGSSSASSRTGTRGRATQPRSL